MSRAVKTGQEGERLAARYVVRKGWTILATNYKVPAGEIDLICEAELPEGRSVIFVEVKTRRTSTFGSPEEALTPRKLARLEAAADTYLYLHQPEDIPCRVDLIAIELHENGHQLKHFEDVTGL